MASIGLEFTTPSGFEDSDRHAQDSSWKMFFTDSSRSSYRGRSKRSPLQPNLKQDVSKDPLWMDSCDNQPRVADESLGPAIIAEHPQASDAPPPPLSWACCQNKDLYKGTDMHSELQKRSVVDGYRLDDLATLYANCGKMEKAQALLDSHGSRNVIAWTALIAGYVRDRGGCKALRCFEQMQSRGIIPDKVTYVSILKACAVVGDIHKGKEVHDEIVRRGLLEKHIVLGGALVDMYAKCGAVHQARGVLENLPSRNLVCWNALIGGYAKSGQGQQALDCFEQMQKEGILPDEVTYVCIVKACAAIGAIDQGEKIYDQIVRQGLLRHHIVLGGALVDMYAKFGALVKARHVIEQLPSRNVVCWNALITGYAQYGQGQQAINCFEEMQREGIVPNEVTYRYIVKACAAIGAIDTGKRVHDEISRRQFLKNNSILGDALVEMYAKFGDLTQAQNVLKKSPSRSVASWGALIAGFVESGQGQQALECFELMKDEAILPNELTYVHLLKACAAVGNTEQGKKFHDQILRQGLLEHHIVLGGALVDMYVKFGDLQRARSVLEELPSRDVVSWGALIAGYADNGQVQQAMDCFEEMQRENIRPDEVTLCCLLNLCGHLGMVEKGQELFDSMDTKYGLKPGAATFACMVDLLGRAGHVSKAIKVIQGMPFPASSDIWHCLLSACRDQVDVDVGSWAFKQALELDECDGPAYSLMARYIHGSQHI